MTDLTLRTRTGAQGTELELAFDHPMESGLRVDGQGTTIPALYLTEVAITFEEKPMATLALGAVVSRNPVVTLMLPNELGDGWVKAAWLDSSGDRGSRSVRLSVADTRPASGEATTPVQGVNSRGGSDKPAGRSTR